MAAATVVALAACSSAGGSSAAGAGASRSASPSASPTGPPTITIDIAGDVHFAGRTAKLLRHPDTAFGPVAKQLSAADVTIVNLETAVTTRGTPQPKEFHFRAPPATFDAVRAAGVDVVTVANNHARVSGRTGLADTLRYAKAAGVPTVGAGADEAQAYRPWITTVHGVRIAFLAFSQVTELAQQWRATPDRPGIAETFDTAKAAAAVRAAKRQADVVIVYPHWGQEGNHCPIAVQRSFATAMAKAGATAVVGTHAHLLLGAGWLGDTYVDYGLGNFLWWRDDAYSNDTGVQRLTLTGSRLTGTRFLPAEISRQTGQPVPASGSDARRITHQVDGLRGCTGLSGTPG